MFVSTYEYNRELLLVAPGFRNSVNKQNLLAYRYLKIKNKIKFFLLGVVSGLNAQTFQNAIKTDSSYYGENQTKKYITKK